MMPDAPIILVDTREQTPLDFEPFGLSVERVTLPFADYGLVGFSGAEPGDLLLFAVERKSLNDLVSSIGGDRARFEREISRMQVYRFKALVIESTEDEVRTGAYRGKMAPEAVFGTLASWTVNYDLHVRFAGNPEGAARMIAKWAWYFWQRRLKEAKHLARAYAAA